MWALVPVALMIDASSLNAVMLLARCTSGDVVTHWVVGWSDHLLAYPATQACMLWSMYRPGPPGARVRALRVFLGRAAAMTVSMLPACFLGWWLARFASPGWETWVYGGVMALTMMLFAGLTQSTRS